MAGRFMTNLYCKQARVFPRTRRILGRAAGGAPPAAKGHQRPHGLDDSERPRPLQKTVDRGQQASRREAQDKQRAALLQGVADQHGRDREEAEQAQAAHAARILLRWAAGRVWQAVRNTSRGARERIRRSSGMVAGALYFAVSRSSQPRPFCTISSGSASSILVSRLIWGKSRFCRAPRIRATQAARRCQRFGDLAQTKTERAREVLAAIMGEIR